MTRKRTQIPVVRAACGLLLSALLVTAGASVSSASEYSPTLQEQAQIASAGQAPEPAVASDSEDVETPQDESCHGTGLCIVADAPSATEGGQELRSESFEAEQPDNSAVSSSGTIYPDWCASSSNQRLYKRFESCASDTGTVTTYDNNVQTGSLRYAITDYAYIGSSSTTTGHAFKITVTNIVGTAATVTFEATSGCSRNPNCSSTPVTLNVGYPVSGSTYDAETTFTVAGALAQGDIKNIPHHWKMTWKRNAFTQIGYTGVSPTCDNAVPGRAAGCAFSDYMPRLSIPLSGVNSAYSNHVYRAVASGLPGGSQASPLNRTTDQALRNLNRDTACPQSLPRPVNLTCDEYPFASTQQGAASGGSARTVQGCNNTTDPYSTGSTGFSRCFIPGDQNSSGGSILGNFYGSQRVKNGEAFFLTFEP